MKKIISLFILFFPILLNAQQVADTTYNPEIKNPAYAKGKGAVVFIDEGHHNFYTKNGRYKAFSNLLGRDGYIVEPYKGAFILSHCKISIYNSSNWLSMTFCLILPGYLMAAQENTVRKDGRRGGYKNYGKGKVVAFGEAAMFTAQLARPQKNEGWNE